MVDSMLNPKDGTIMSESNRKAVEASRSSSDAGAAKGRDPSMAAVAVAQEEARKQTLPKYNKEAEQPCDAYDARDIAGPEGWARVSHIVRACLEKEDFFEALTGRKGPPQTNKDKSPPEERGWSPAVLECIRKLSPRADEVENESSMEGENTNERTTLRYQMRCALLLHYLVKFYRKFNFKGGRGGAVPGLEEGQNVWFGMPKGLAVFWLDTLATQQMPYGNNNRRIPGLDQKDQERPKRGQVSDDVPRYLMTPANKDKLMVEVLLVYIMARSGKKMRVEDITPIMEDLDLDVKKTSTLLRMAGFTVTFVPSTKKTRVELQVPLTFPQLRKGGRGKK
jgi:hypothetical protein